MSAMEKMKISGEKRVEISKSSAISLEDGSIATIIIRPDIDSEVKVDAGKDCRITVFSIQDKPVRISMANRLGPGSELDSFSLWLQGSEGSTSNELAGNGSRVYDSHILVGKDGSDQKITAKLVHYGKGTSGDIAINGVLIGKSKAAVDGLVKVMKTGSGAQSLLSGKVLLLDDGSSAMIRPDIEIENNDVSTKHAATVSKISEEKIFYLMSRGLTKEEAKGAIAAGLLTAAFDRIGDDALKKEFSEKTMARICDNSV